MKRSLLLQASASPRLKPLLLSALLAATPGLAAAQFKCVDKAGNITLTDLACPGRNARGKNNAEHSAPASAPENTQATRDNSATVNKGSAPTKQQPLDATNDKPPVRMKPNQTRA